VDEVSAKNIITNLITWLLNNIAKVTSDRRPDTALSVGGS